MSVNAGRLQSHTERFSGRGYSRGLCRGQVKDCGVFYANYNNSGNKNNIPETVNVEGKTLYLKKVYKKNEYKQ